MVMMMMKVETNVKLETTGFGRDDGGCLGAPFLKPRMSMGEETKTSDDFFI